MSAPLLPQAFWFRLALPCRRVDGLPRSQGRLLDLPASCALPATAALEGREPWAEVRVAWNPGGLAVTVEARRRAGAIASDPEAADGVEVWVDTRDTRTIHRASRFCHRFAAVLTARGRASGAVDVAVSRRPIARALAEPPPLRSGSIPARAELMRGAWRLELFLPAEALHGFDPETNRRLGFCYRAFGPDADQVLGVGREFPVGEDPSLWSTLELRD
jgi:hypothetical protein